MHMSNAGVGCGLAFAKVDGVFSRCVLLELKVKIDLILLKPIP